jgi:hypothetical protein
MGYYCLDSRPYRKRELAPAINLLEKAGIVHRIYHSNAKGLPLGADLSFESFKIITLDIGLNQNILGLDFQDWLLDPAKTMVNKGNIAEAFVGQEILAYSDPNFKKQLHYWQREARGSHAEIDYLSVFQQQIIPVEVKSGRGSSLQSMRLFLESYPSSPYGIRFSTHNFSSFDSIHSYPLYAVANCFGNKKRLVQFLNES